MSTIAAVSTPRGKGGIAVIRISGDEAVRIASDMFKLKSGKKLSDIPARYAAYGDILDSSNVPCDSGICVVYRAPNSFTGEDSCEISCHGGTCITMTVLASAFAHGAEPAQAGEFTKRAFINGRMSLTEAEAVGRLIDSDTEEKMRLSSGALRGNVSREIKKTADSLVDVMTALYAAIDYPDEDIGTEGEDNIASVVDSALSDVRRILSTYKTGKAVCDGVKTVICGKPNVGKSSIFNLITGESSAIVTDVAGTTRDVLRESVSFGGVTLRLSDTAGIHESSDAVEKIGIDRANSEISAAELVLAVYTAEDCIQSAVSDLSVNLLSVSECAKIAVINKTDLYNGEPLNEEFVTSLLSTYDSIVLMSCAENGTVCGTSAIERAFCEISAAQAESVQESSSNCRVYIGLSGLSEAISELYGSDRIDISNDAVIWDARQQASLSRAAEWLEEASASLKFGAAADAVCTSVESAAAALNETDGRGITEEIVNGIFHRFCVGK